MKPILQAIVVFIVSLLAPLAVLVALFGVKREAQASIDPHTGLAIRIGYLPRWAAWWADPIEPLPGGLYEPTQLRIYKLLKFYGAAYYWLGLRNRAHGLAMRFQKPMTGYFYLEASDGMHRRDGVWQYYKGLGPLCFVAGYRAYHTPALGYYGTPVFTLKRA